MEVLIEATGEDPIVRREYAETTEVSDDTTAEES